MSRASHCVRLNTSVFTFAFFGHTEKENVLPNRTEYCAWLRLQLQFASKTEHQVNKLQSIKLRMAFLDVTNQTIIEIPIIDTDFVITSQFVTNKLTAAAKRSLNGNVYICAAVNKVLKGTNERSIDLDCLCQPCWHDTYVWIHRTISCPLILAERSKRTHSYSSAVSSGLKCLCS